MLARLDAQPGDWIAWRPAHRRKGYSIQLGRIDELVHELDWAAGPQLIGCWVRGRGGTTREYVRADQVTSKPSEEAVRYAT